MSDLSWRRLLAGGPAEAASAGVARLARAASGAPQRGDEGGSILGPRNEPLERENPGVLTPPSTDAGDLPNLKFSFDAAHTRLTDGGWTRQITVRDFPTATAGLRTVGRRARVLPACAT